jgi:hypothetical protein
MYKRVDNAHTPSIMIAIQCFALDGGVYYARLFLAKL